MKRSIEHRLTPRRLQSGVALITSLILLAVLTLIGIAAMQMTTIEERMAGNLEAQNQAFQRAEGTLGEAQRFLSRTLNLSDFTASGAQGLYDYIAPDGDAASSIPDYGLAATWDPTVTRQAEHHDNARYFIELETPEPVVKPGQPCVPGGTCSMVLVFRITARATDDTGNAVVILRQRFAKIVASS
jgi:type IV pilus assembly protein PilX